MSRTGYCLEYGDVLGGECLGLVKGGECLGRGYPGHGMSRAGVPRGRCGKCWRHCIVSNLASKQCQTSKLDFFTFKHDRNINIKMLNGGLNQKTGI